MKAKFYLHQTNRIRGCQIKVPIQTKSTETVARHLLRQHKNCTGIRRIQALCQDQLTSMSF